MGSEHPSEEACSLEVGGCELPVEGHPNCDTHRSQSLPMRHKVYVEAPGAIVPQEQDHDGKRAW